MVENMVTGVVAGIVAGITAPLILAWLQTSKWWRKRKVARIIDNSQGLNWSAERLLEMLEPNHENYDIVCEVVNENVSYLRAGKWGKRRLKFWAWIRGV